MERFHVALFYLALPLTYDAISYILWWFFFRTVLKYLLLLLFFIRFLSLAPFSPRFGSLLRRCASNQRAKLSAEGAGIWYNAGKIQIFTQCGSWRKIPATNKLPTLRRIILCQREFVMIRIRNRFVANASRCWCKEEKKRYYSSHFRNVITFTFFFLIKHNTQFACLIHNLNVEIVSMRYTCHRHFIRWHLRWFL